MIFKKEEKHKIENKKIYIRHVLCIKDHITGNIKNNGYNLLNYVGKKKKNRLETHYLEEF